MKLRFVAGLLIISSISLNAHALKIDMKPGLWEHAFKFDKNSMGAMGGAQQDQMNKAMEEMKTQMANLPPEQRKMMEDMMAKQGMNMSFGAGGVTTIKVCITPEMANRPPLEQRDSCTYNFPARSGSTQRFSYQCSKPVSNGEGEIVFKGADDYDGKMKMTSTEGARKETITMLTTGKFLGANCGNVKPMAAPKG
jgi:hypothetical protein